MRKGLGYKYEHQTRRLPHLVVFMKNHKATTITTKLAMEWATRSSCVLGNTLTDVRGFARISKRQEVAEQLAG
jgi:hypothetical protein